MTRSREENGGEPGVSLSRPSNTVEKQQTLLQTKAKTVQAFRSYTLWDKVCRTGILPTAYCRCHENVEAAGVDNVTFERI